MPGSSREPRTSTTRPTGGVARWRIDDLHHDHLTSLSTTHIGGTNEDIVLDPLVLWRHQNDAALVNKTANELPSGMLEHLEDDGLWSAPTVSGLDPCQDSVAMHCLEHFPR